LYIIQRNIGLRFGMVRVIVSQQFGFVEFDGAGILPDVTCIVNPTWELFKVAFLNSLQRASADFGVLRNLLEGKTSVATDRS